MPQHPYDRLPPVDPDQGLQSGDLFACWGADAASRLISYGTSSLLSPRGLRFGPSHIALIASCAGRLRWFESTSLCQHPCLVMGRLVEGVQSQDVDSRLHDYVARGGEVALYRMTELARLSQWEADTLSDLLLRLCGRPYDLAGAMCSGSRVFQRTRLFPRADLNHVFCSELVAACLMRFNRMNHANPTRYNPARLLRELVYQGTYREIRRWSA